MKLVRQELYDDVRPNVVVVLFSVRDTESFTSLHPKVGTLFLPCVCADILQILPAVRSTYNDLPILLVGTKAERDGSVEEVITYDQAWHLSLWKMHADVSLSRRSGCAIR